MGSGATSTMRWLRFHRLAGDRRGDITSMRTSPACWITIPTSRRQPSKHLYAPDQFRVSDHDPVIVGLCLPPSLTISVTPDVLSSPNHKYVTVTVTADASSGHFGHQPALGHIQRT